MKTITQLQNVAKRLPRLKKASQRILAKGRRGGQPLTDNQIGFHNMRILSCEQGLRLLAGELWTRRVGLAPFRDATPNRLRKLKEDAFLAGYGAGKNAVARAVARGAL